jgi:hypothetical protein
LLAAGVIDSKGVCCAVRVGINVVGWDIVDGIVVVVVIVVVAVVYTNVTAVIVQARVKAVVIGGIVAFVARAS